MLITFAVLVANLLVDLLYVWLDPRTRGVVMSSLKSVWKNRKAQSGLGLLTVILVIAVVGPFLVQDPAAFVAEPHQPPGSDHWMGTTGQGQDVLAQTVAGARITLIVGFLVGLAVTAIGALVGITAGFFGGRVDRLISLVVNVFLVIPGLPLAIIIAAYLPRVRSRSPWF